MSGAATKKIAEKDFYVYKIGKVVWDTIFISDPVTNKKYDISPIVAYDANLKKIGKPY